MVREDGPGLVGGGEVPSEYVLTGGSGGYMRTPPCGHTE